MSPRLKNLNKKQTSFLVSVKETQKIPDDVLKTYRTLIAELDKGLPRATSGEVLSSRVKW